MITCDPRLLSDDQLTLTTLKEQLNLFSVQQKNAFINHCSVASLIYQRSDYIDALLARLWTFFKLDKATDLSLIAVGGYGRRELHPLSDIDLLILSNAQQSPCHEQQIAQFIALLWDIKLEVGHSVRDLSQCIEVGSQDLSVATSLQEARYLCGNHSVYLSLIQTLFSDDFGSSAVFFKGKINEQTQRHARYHNTAYNLEPDIKSTPGGLRDIHTLRWIARRHFGATSLREMSKYGFLTEGEFRELDECQTALWRTRFALHIELRRYDNRLTFTHQLAVAHHLGYQGEGHRPVETMMKDFYRTLSRVSELNKMLIRLFAREIENEPKDEAIDIIDDDFLRCGLQIQARKPALFQARPDTILDMFLHIANHAQITSISAPTLRQLRTARRRLNRFLCDIPCAKEKFMRLIYHPNTLHKALPLMHKHGVLSAYFPQWSQIVGQMQFDLFHTYTVDEHTIRLLLHIQGFTQEDNRALHPICCEIYPKLAKPQLLRLAAIFHDIGKAREGCHSEIGAKEAYDFCLNHGLTRPDANLVSWLVRHHLLMSVTAQRRDIYDPDVISEFAKKVRNEERLNLLLCLTVADINATNPSLWNSWKRTLLSELYFATQKALRRGLENPLNIREKIRHNQKLASAILSKKGHKLQPILQLWHRFKADYFFRHTPKQLAWHSDHILDHKQDSPLVLISKKATRGGTEIFVYSKDKPTLFARVVAALDKKNLNVHDAQIMTSKDGFSLDTFLVLDANDQPVSLDRHQAILNDVSCAILQQGAILPSTRKAPSQIKAFDIKDKISFLATRNTKKTMLELTTLDRPGLLSQIGAVLAKQNTVLQAAKITTIGERAEDIFIISNEQGQALSLLQQTKLKQALHKKLSIITSS